MSDLSVTYSKVQLYKELPWEPPSEVVEAVAKQFFREQGRPITAAEQMTALNGIGWIARMCAQEGVDFGEVTGIAEHLRDALRRNLSRIVDATEGGAAEDPLSFGVGGGFFTGLWVGLMLRRECDDPEGGDLSD